MFTNLLLSIALVLPATATLPVAPAATVASPTLDDGRGTPYNVNKSDNICGLDEPRQLTNPAVVDYDALIKQTAEHKKLVKDKIDENSSEGITLMSKARAKVLKACESVRATAGHCSVWKEIKRRDKRAVTDITDLVKRQL